MKPRDCPLYPEMQAVQLASVNLSRSVRNLRRKLNVCEACECYENCKVMDEFNHTVQTVIQEISDEWNLGAIFQ